MAFNLHEAARLTAPLPCRARPVLYTHTLCPYAQRVLVTLLHKDLPQGCELVHVDLADKPRWYRQVNPAGLVPAVVDTTGTIHTESLDICRWLDGTFEQPAMIPTDPVAREQMEALMHGTPSVEAAGLELCAGSTASSWSLGRSPSKAQRQQFEQETQQLARALQQLGGPFLAGPALSLADVALFPFFERFEAALQLHQELELSSLHAGAIIKWMEHMRSLPCCALASPDAALFRAALQQHRSLDFFDFHSFPPLELHPHMRQYVATTAAPQQQQQQQQRRLQRRHD